MRQFRHLTRAEITDIIVSHTNGESQADLARRFEVDHSTVSYHVEKYRKASSYAGSGLYAVIKMKMQRVCEHPSSKCTLCGIMFDQIRREETQRIRSLERQLADASAQLRSAGLLVE